MGRDPSPYPHRDSATPDAWPLLLSRELACAYLQVSVDTFARICPVAPLDLGVNLLRWSRPQLDAWVAALPARLRHAREGAQTEPPATAAVPDPAQDRRLSAVERAKARSLCPNRQSRSSSASSGRMGASTSTSAARASIDA